MQTKRLVRILFIGLVVVVVVLVLLAEKAGGDLRVLSRHDCFVLVSRECRRLSAEVAEASFNESSLACEYVCKTSRFFLFSEKREEVCYVWSGFERSHLRVFLSQGVSGVCDV